MIPLVGGEPKKQEAIPGDVVTPSGHLLVSTVQVNEVYDTGFTPFAREAIEAGGMQIVDRGQVMVTWQQAHQAHLHGWITKGLVTFFHGAPEVNCVLIEKD